MALKKTKVIKPAKKKKEKSVKGAPAKIKPNKFLSGSRFVLFIGDEGTILLHMKGNAVLSRQFVPDAGEQNLEELRTTINTDPKAMISMAIDSMDQSYAQQSLPPVSSMSVNKLIKRRLERDYGANDIKGAILLGREDIGRKDWNFLMVSVERSRQLSLWLDFVFALPNRFQGIFLVSVETEIIIKNLEHSMGVPKTGTGSKWKFFVSHNKVGGFRQVILHNGRIIFTRMAQPIGESTPEVIAGNIEQEMLSTMEYMKRLSYNPQDGLDIYIIASANIKPIVDKTKFAVSNFNIFTPYEVSGFLGIEGASQPSDQFGDVILAASICSSPKHVLKLSTPESRKFDNLYMAFRSQRTIGILTILGILGYGIGIGSDIYLRYDEADDLLITKRQHEVKFSDLREEITKSSIDVDKTGDALDIYQVLLKQQSSPMKFIQQLELIIKPPIVITGFEWTLDDKTASGSASTPSKLTALVTMQFPSVPDIDAWRIVSKKLLDDLKGSFKEYTITFSKLPPKFTETGTLDLNFDTPKEQPVPTSQNQEVQLTIKEN